MNPQDITNRVLVPWARDFVAHRIKDARAADLKATGTFLSSFNYQVIKATAGTVASALVEFDSAGRYADMRKLSRNKQQPIEEIEEWVRARGVQQFRAKFARKYRLPATESRLMTQIAWAIVKTKKRRKRKKWYSKNREEDFDILYNRLMEGLQDGTLKAIKDGTQKG